MACGTPLPARIFRHSPAFSGATPRNGLIRNTPFLLLPLCLAIAGFVGGCAIDPNKEIALYRKVLDGPTTRPIAYTPGEPLSLTAALQLTNQNDERLAIAGEDYLQSLIDKDRVAASFYPTISLVPSYSKADSSTDTGAKRLIGGSTADVTELQNRTSLSSGNGKWDVPVNANWNAFRGFRDVANYRRAQSDIERFRALLLDLKATVMLDVAQTYYQVLRSEATVKVLENSSTLQDARVAEMRAKDKVGSARKLDVAQAEAQAANTRAQLAGARADVRNGRTLLVYLTSAQVADAPLVDRLAVPPDAIDIEATLQQAESNRQDVVAAEAATRSAAQAVQSAVGQYYPSVSLNFNYYLSRQSTPEDSLWNGLLSINLPLFTAGRIHADVRTANSQLRQAKLREQQARRRVEQQVRTAIENLQASNRRLAELHIAVEAAQQAVDVAEGNYHAGTGIYLERLVAQDQLLSAQLQSANESYALKLTYLNLLRETGALREAPAESPTTRP